MRLALLAASALALAACASPMRLAVPPAPAGEPIGIGFASVEVLEVSLPAYADGDDVYVLEGGALQPAAGVIWADDPSRALTLDLVRALGAVTGARVAGEPWPFDEAAEARLDVRVTEIAAATATDGAGSFVLRGQFFVGAFDESGRDRAREFAIAVPLPPGGDPAAIATARGQATAALAREVAAEGLR